jgi:hypothetical protein
MFFGVMECRAVFELPSDKGKIQRVCGRKIGTCTRQGHGVLAKGIEGYYKTVASRKYVDGRLTTFVANAAFEVEETERKVKNKGDLENAAEWLCQLGVSPGVSVEAGRGVVIKKSPEVSMQDDKQKYREGGEVEEKVMVKVMDEDARTGRPRNALGTSRPRALDTDFRDITGEEHENRLLASPNVQEIAKKEKNGDGPDRTHGQVGRRSDGVESPYFRTGEGSGGKSQGYCE